MGNDSCQCFEENSYTGAMTQDLHAITACSSSSASCAGRTPAPCPPECTRRSARTAQGGMRCRPTAVRWRTGRPPKCTRVCSGQEQGDDHPGHAPDCLLLLSPCIPAKGRPPPPLGRTTRNLVQPTCEQSLGCQHTSPPPPLSPVCWIRRRRRHKRAPSKSAFNGHFRIQMLLNAGSNAEPPSAQKHT